MSDMPPRRLPGELNDMIIDFLHDDDESLANCALVCKDWLPSSRYHFSSTKQPFVHPWNVEAFMDLMTDSATFIPFMHGLILDQIKFRHMELFETIFLRLPQRFDLVRRLELRDFCFFVYLDPALDSLSSTFKNVTDLALEWPIFQNHREMMSVVASFTSLERLVVTMAMFRHRPSPLSTDLDATDFLLHTIPPQIRTLQVTELSQHRTYLLDWFLAQDITVDSLSVELETSALPSLNRYLRALGPSLLSFEARFRYQSPVSGYLEHLNLSSNTHLQKLQFFECTFFLWLAAFSSLLAKIVSPHLSEIEFANDHPVPRKTLRLLRLENDANATSNSPGWRSVDTILSNLGGLHSIHINYSADQPDVPSYIGYVRNGLPLCNARGVLSFERRVALDEDLSPKFRTGTVTGPFCIENAQEPTV